MIDRLLFYRLIISLVVIKIGRDFSRCPLMSLSYYSVRDDLNGAYNYGRRNEGTVRRVIITIRLDLCQQKKYGTRGSLANCDAGDEKYFYLFTSQRAIDCSDFTLYLFFIVFVFFLIEFLSNINQTKNIFIYRPYRNAINYFQIVSHLHICPFKIFQAISVS